MISAQFGRIPRSNIQYRIVAGMQQGLLGKTDHGEWQSYLELIGSLAHGNQFYHTVVVLDSQDLYRIIRYVPAIGWQFDRPSYPDLDQAIAVASLTSTGG